MPQESNNNFASKDGNPKAASVRIGAVTARKLGGQIRHDLRRGRQPGYVDMDRSHLNRVLLEPAPSGAMRSICKERRALRETERSMKSNSAIATRGMITFGSQAAQMFEKLSPAQQDAAFQELAQAIADRLATSLHGLVVHLDEATIHAHYQLAAYNIYGEPISKTTSPKVLAELQDITAEVMGRHCPGIERGHRYGDRLAAGADWSDVIHKSVSELHRTLPADLAKKRAVLADLDQAEIDAGARVDEMRGRVQKLAEKADLTEKQVKRLATYEKRLADRLIELKAAEEASQVARAEADRLANLAHVDRQEQEDRAKKISAKADAVGAAVAALSEEVEAKTIRRTPDGKITVSQPDRLRPAMPEIGPAVVAAADFVAGMDAARFDLATDQAALRSEQCDLINAQNQLLKDGLEVQSLRATLKEALRRVLSFIKRPGVDDEIAAEGRDLLRDVTPILLPPKEPSEDSGPGF